VRVKASIRTGHDQSLVIAEPSPGLGNSKAARGLADAAIRQPEYPCSLKLKERSMDRDGAVRGKSVIEDAHSVRHRGEIRRWIVPPADRTDHISRVRVIREPNEIESFPSPPRRGEAVQEPLVAKA